LQPPYHPLFVHFPIALYLLGVLLTLGALWHKNESIRADYNRFAYWVFFLSWLAAIAASLVGLVDRGRLDFDDPRQQAMDRHISPAIGFMVLNGLILYIRFRWSDVLQTSRRWIYLLLIAFGTIALLATGLYGGDLVYDLQVGLR